MIKNSRGSFQAPTSSVVFFFGVTKIFQKKNTHTSPTATNQPIRGTKIKSSHLELFGSFFEATRHPKGYNLGVISHGDGNVISPLSKINCLEIPVVVVFKIRNTNYEIAIFLQLAMFAGR